MKYGSPHITEGARYAYQLPDGIYPDPASRWQPEGVHKPSAVFSPETFTWSDQSWPGVLSQDLVIYELHVGVFTKEGTFEAIEARLQELKALGVTAIEIMPVAQFPGDRNWGYDGVYPYAVQNSYGGPRALQRLVDAAHREGLAVFLDVVYNHLGPEGNYLMKFGPYFTDRYRTPWGKGRQLRRKLQRRGSSVRDRQCLHVGPRFSHRWAATGCRSYHFRLRHTTDLGGPSEGGSTNRSGAVS